MPVLRMSSRTGKTGASRQGEHERRARRFKTRTICHSNTHGNGPLDRRSHAKLQILDSLTEFVNHEPLQRSRKMLPTDKAGKRLASSHRDHANWIAMVS